MKVSPVKTPTVIEEVKPEPMELVEDVKEEKPEVKEEMSKPTLRERSHSAKG